MLSFLSRARFAIFFLVLLLACGCGQLDNLVNGYQADLSDGSGSGAGSGSGSGGGNSGGSGSRFDDLSPSCKALGKYIESIEIEVASTDFKGVESSPDFSSVKSYKLNGFDAAKSLDKALGDLGAIDSGNYKELSLELVKISLKTKAKFGGEVKEAHLASGEIKIKMDPSLKIGADGKRGRINFDLCKNFVMNGPRNDGKCPKDFNFTPEVNAKVVNNPQ